MLKILRGVIFKIKALKTNYTKPKVVFGFAHRPVRDGIFVTANFNWREMGLNYPICHVVTALCRKDVVTP